MLNIYKKRVLTDRDRSNCWWKRTKKKRYNFCSAFEYFKM